MKKNYFLLLLSGFLVSFTGLFAKKIDLPANTIVWWRCFLCILLLTPALVIAKKWKVSKESIPWLVISGFLFGVNWWAFFICIQMTTVSLGVVVLFTFPLISAILEPLYNKTELSRRQVIGGIGILAGVYFLVPEFSLTNTKTIGVLYGLLSAFCLSGRNIIMRKKLVSIPALTVLNYQIFVALIVVSIPFLSVANKFSVPIGTDLWYTCLLAIPFTIGAHGLIAYNLKHFSATTSGILGSLQVVYSSLFAFIFLGEVPETSSYFGATIIVSVAIYEMYTKKK